MPNPPDPTRGKLLAIAALVGGWLLFHGRAIFTDGAPYHRDILHTIIPIRAYLRERLLAGELPHWYPYEALGTPFLGQIVTAVWHPLTWLFLPFDAVTAVKWNVLLVSLLSLAGAYRAARRLGASRAGAVGGAFVFGFGGYAVSMTNNLVYLTSLATLPFALEAALKLASRRRPRDAAFLGVMTALLFLGGDPQAALFSSLFWGYAVLVHGPDKRALGMFGVAGVVAILLSAVELVPAAILSSESIRADALKDFRLWGFAPLRLLELVCAGFVPHGYARRLGAELFGGAQYVWAQSVFVGGLAIVLAIGALARAGRREWGLVVIALFGTLLAFGDAGGVLPLVERLVPILARFRFSEKYLVVAALSGSMLVAIGIDRITVRPFVVTASILGIASVAAAIQISRGFASNYWDPTFRDYPQDPPIAAVFDHAWSTGFAWTAGILGAAIVAVLLARRFVAGPAVLVAIGFVELWHGNGAVMRLAPHAAFEGTTPFEADILASAPPNGPPSRLFHTISDEFLRYVHDDASRVTWERAALIPMSSGLAHVTSFGTMLPLLSTRTRRLLGMGVRPAEAHAWALGGCFNLAPATRPVHEGERVMQLVPSEGWRLLEQPCRPRAMLARTIGVASLDDAFSALGKVIPRDTVVWEGGPDVASAAGTVAWESYASERLVLHVDAPEATALVVHDQFFPGWSAFVDGAPATIHATTIVARGIEVPEGAHTVEWRYTTPGLATGAWGSAAGLSLVALLLRRREKRLS